MRTRIKNLVSGPRFYGFLPMHGMLLDSQQEVILDGDLRTNLAGGENRYNRRTELTELQKALNHLDLEYEELLDPQPSSSSSAVPSSSSSSGPSSSSSSTP